MRQFSIHPSLLCLLMLPTGAAGSRQVLCSSITPGHSRCEAASIFRAHIEGKMLLLPLFVHASGSPPSVLPSRACGTLSKARAARSFSISTTHGLPSLLPVYEFIFVFYGYFLGQNISYEETEHNITVFL
jgi:hypothetical protein